MVSPNVVHMCLIFNSSHFYSAITIYYFQIYGLHRSYFFLTTNNFFFFIFITFFNRRHHRSLILSRLGKEMIRWAGCRYIRIIYILLKYYITCRSSHINKLYDKWKYIKIVFYTHIFNRKFYEVFQFEFMFLFFFYSFV